MFRKLCFVLLFAQLLFAQQAEIPRTQEVNSAAEPAAELRLDDVLREVLSANPALVRSSTLVAAQRAHVKQTGVLPDPTVTLSWMGEPGPFKVMDNDPSS